MQLDDFCKTLAKKKKEKKVNIVLTGQKKVILAQKSQFHDEGHERSQKIWYGAISQQMSFLKKILLELKWNLIEIFLMCTIIVEKNSDFSTQASIL